MPSKPKPKPRPISGANRPQADEEAATASEARAGSCRQLGHQCVMVVCGPATR
jgi:hypothetical protein